MEPISRNAPCPCGSGKRYKQCCGAPAPPPAQDASALLALGAAEAERGRTDAALAAYRRALALAETPDARARFAQLVQQLEFRSIDPELRGLVARALSEAWVRPADLATTAVQILGLTADLRSRIAAAERAWPQRLDDEALFGPRGAAGLADDGLLCALLESAPIPDVALERYLTMARHSLLDSAVAVARDGVPPHEPGAFECALARQCLVNDFVYALDDEEQGRADALRERLAAALRDGDAIAPAWVVAVAAYFPLALLPSSERLLELHLSGPVRALVVQHVEEALEERRCRATIPVLTPIDDAVSVAVRAQYEEHPYPRWIDTPRPAKPMSLDAYLREWFPDVPQHSVGAGESLDLLVAGCGTGRETIDLARQIAGARVLAVDLSLASLCYAKRKARELGVANVEFAQADINGLDALDRSFDVVSSVGVLHHLADPVAGMTKLARRLRPGGFMILGLYSERGRRSVVAARQYIAERGYTATAAGIRRCRQDLLTLDDGAPARRVTAYGDFYVTGECRDLLFHVQEHRYTLPRIKSILAGLGLRFHGFHFDARATRAYRERFPGDATRSDLDRWNEIEDALPQTFAGMYVFLVRKPEDAPAG
jgi:SAM-dependent methyltransferase